MSNHDLRDSTGGFIGSIVTTSDGVLELRDANGSFKGTYDPRSNETRNSNGSVVATGNMLTTLL